MPLTGAIGGVLLFLACGLPLAHVAPALRRRPWPARLGWAYLLGLGSLAGALYVASGVAGLPLRRGSVVLVALAVVGAALPFARRRGRRRRAPRRVDPFVACCGALAATIVLGVFAESASTCVFDWDSRMHWNVSARLIRAERTVNARALRDERVFLTNARYPLLMPVAQVAVQELFDADDDERVVRPLWAASFAAFLLVVFDAARRVAGARAAAAVTLLAAGLPQMSLPRVGAGLGCSGDLPLACFYGGGLVLLLVDGRDVRAALLAGILLAAGVLSKKEGLPIAALGIAVAAFTAMRAPVPLARRLRSAALATVPVVAAGCFVAIWRAPIPARVEVTFAGALGLSTLARIPGNLAATLPLVPSRMLERDAWGLFWPAAVAVLALGWRAWRRPRVRHLMLAALPPLCVAIGAYALSGSEWLLLSTWNRLLLQASLPGLVVLAAALRGTAAPP